MERDMTTGAPGKIILNFTIPIFIGNMFQQLYSMVDTIIVGKFVGNEALAAVGSCGTLMFLILGFLIGLTAGFMVITSQHYGSGNMRAMRQSVASAAILSAVISVLMTLCSMLMMKQILHLMNTPEDIYQEAYGYIMVICGNEYYTNKMKEEDKSEAEQVIEESLAQENIDLTNIDFGSEYGGKGDK